MFKKGEIWAYPTDTSFGLGVRADDRNGLKMLQKLKARSGGKYFSLMVRNWEMLSQFANLDGVDIIRPSFFAERPRTAILKPSKLLPKSDFWPTEKVAFRLCTIPKVAEQIIYPVTATSANISGESPIYSVQVLQDLFGNSIEVYDSIPILSKVEPSEIWDFTGKKVVRIR